MPRLNTPEEARAEIERLRTLASDISKKIPRYEERRPELAKEARATARLYRKQAKLIEENLK